MHDRRAERSLTRCRVSAARCDTAVHTSKVHRVQYYLVYASEVVTAWAQPLATGDEK